LVLPLQQWPKALHHQSNPLPGTKLRRTSQSETELINIRRAGILHANSSPPYPSSLGAAFPVRNKECGPSQATSRYNAFKSSSNSPTTQQMSVVKAHEVQHRLCHHLNKSTSQTGTAMANAHNNQTPEYSRVRSSGTQARLAYPEATHRQTTKGTGTERPWQAHNAGTPSAHQHSDKIALLQTRMITTRNDRS
jgi:hypothetical protein